MTSLTNVLSLFLGLACVISAWTQDDAPPVDCDALDEWLPVGMVTTSNAPFSIHLDTKQYAIADSISVTVKGETDFIDVILQARSISREHDQPLGIWIFDNVTDIFSCHGMSHDTAVIREPLLVRHAIFKWLPLDTYGAIQFVAFVTEPNGNVANIVSDVINPSNQMAYSQAFSSKRSRLRRDVQKEKLTNSSAVNEVTTEKPITTEIPPTPTPFDLETFFYYFSIAIAYVGMYTVFSLLLV